MWGYIHRKTPWHIGGRDNYGLEYTEQVSSGGEDLDEPCKMGREEHTEQRHAGGNWAQHRQETVTSSVMENVGEEGRHLLCPLCPD